MSRRATRCALTFHVGTQDPGAEGFELRHHCLCLKRDARAPAVNGDVSPGSVERDDDLFSADFFCELPQESGVYFSAAESGASNNDLARAPSGNFLGARNSSNPAAHAHFHAEIFSRTGAEVAHEFVILAFLHGGIEVDDVQPGISFEFLQEAEDVGDSKLELPPVNQLNRLSVLQIDAGNQHGRRTPTAPTDK